MSERGARGEEVWGGQREGGPQGWEYKDSIGGCVWGIGGSGGDVGRDGTQSGGRAFLLSPENETKNMPKVIQAYRYILLSIIYIFINYKGIENKIDVDPRKDDDAYLMSS